MSKKVKVAPKFSVSLAIGLVADLVCYALLFNQGLFIAYVFSILAGKTVFIILDRFVFLGVKFDIDFLAMQILRRYRHILKLYFVYLIISCISVGFGIIFKLILTVYDIIKEYKVELRILNTCTEELNTEVELDVTE